MLLQTSILFGSLLACVSAGPPGPSDVSARNYFPQRRAASETHSFTTKPHRRRELSEDASLRSPRARAPLYAGLATVSTANDHGLERRDGCITCLGISALAACVVGTGCCCRKTGKNSNAGGPYPVTHLDGTPATKAPYGRNRLGFKRRKPKEPTVEDSGRRWWGGKRTKSKNEKNAMEANTATRQPETLALQEGEAAGPGSMMQGSGTGTPAQGGENAEDEAGGGGPGLVGPRATVAQGRQGGGVPPEIQGQAFGGPGGSYNQAPRAAEPALQAVPGGALPHAAAAAAGDGGVSAQLAGQQQVQFGGASMMQSGGMGGAGGAGLM